MLYMMCYFPKYFLELQQFLSQELPEPNVESLYLKTVILYPPFHLWKLVASAPSGGMESHNLASTCKDLPLFICFECIHCWLCLMPLGLP